MIAPLPADSHTAFMLGQQQKTSGESPGLTVDPFRQFAAAWNTSSKVYSARFDEARRNSESDARAMWRDAFFRALVQERVAPLTEWKWEVKADPDDIPEPAAPLISGPAGGMNPKDPYSDEREKIQKSLNACVRRTAGFHQLRQYLSQAVWFGRYGSQVRWDDATIAGERRKVIGYHDPIVGDKIHYTFDGHPGVMVSPTVKSDRPEWDIRTFDTYGPVLILNRPELRSRFIVHRHVVEDADFMDGQAAGRRHGVGIRDFVYWSWWMRDEMLAWLMGFMEKVGSLGILCFYYNESNEESRKKTEAAARQVGNGNALAIPVKATDPRVGSVDLIPANMTGVGFLKEIIGDYFERHIERLIVGQSMSSGADNGDGLGGTGRAKFAQETKFYLLAFDARNMADTFTRDIVGPMTELNFRGCRFRYEFQFVLPDPNAKDKLEAGTKLTSAGVTIKTDELREAGGYTKPGPEDETVGGQQPGMGPDGSPLPGGGMGGGAMGPDGQPVAPGGPAVDPNSGGESQQTPGMAELVTAMVRAGASGNVAAVNALARLGSNPDKLQSIIGEGGDEKGVQNTHAPDETDDEPRVYRWAGDRSEGGATKAVWTGPGERPPLYGERAEAAIRAQDEQKNQEQPGQRQAGQKPVSRPASGGARVMQQFREKAAPHRERAVDVYNRAIENPGSVQPHELEGLASHLNTMTADQLRGVAKSMSLRSGGLKEDVIRRLLEHVGASVGDAATSARSAGINFDLQTGAKLEELHNQGGDWRPAANDKPVDSINVSSNPQKNEEKSTDWRPKATPDGNKVGVELPATDWRPKSTPSAAGGDLATSGVSHPETAKNTKYAPVISAKPGREERKKAWTGATEAAKKRWADNAALVEKQIETLKQKIETIDKKESVAAMIRKKFKKIRWDSEMETVYGSIKDAADNGFPRSLLSKSEGLSIDQIAESGEIDEFMHGKPDDRNATDWLIEQIATGARQNVETSGERERMAEELWHLERNRENVSDVNKLAEYIRRGRNAHKSKTRAGGSGKPGTGGGVDEDTPGWFEHESGPETEELNPEVESELDDIFGDFKAADAKNSESAGKINGSGSSSSRQEKDASDDGPDWYPEYRQLRNRFDSGGKLKPDESSRLEALERLLRESAGVKPNQYRAPWGGLTAATWWDSLTLAERRTLVGSSNFRRAASGLRGNAASIPSGRDPTVDQFVTFCYQQHRKTTA